MSIKYDKYMPLYTYLSPASIPQIVAHIQDYLVKNPILSVETIAEIIVQSLQEHPELLNGEAIPISADSEQSIKAYIDSLPSVDTYTKAEINLLLTGKQDTLTFDQAPTPGSSNPVTSSGIIAAISSVQSTLETLIEAKADSASTYTKSQVDTLLTDKADVDDVYSKNTMDAKLLEYATSDSVYSKADINTMKQVNKANLAIVSSDGTAPLDIAAGQYVYMDDVMFMATEDILTGARLIPNSNIVLNPTGVTNRIGDGLKNAVTQINGLADTVSSQSQQIDEKADIPVTVTVTVDASGASMSAADAAKLTADMVMCWYVGDKTILTANLTILPGAGTATVTGTASSSTTFTIAFIHSVNNTAIASVIPYETGKISFSNVLPCRIFKDGNTCICQSTYNRLPANIPSGTATQIATLPYDFSGKSTQFFPAMITDNDGNFKTYAVFAVDGTKLTVFPQTTLTANSFNFFTFTYSTI